MKKILIINNEKDIDDLGWVDVIKNAILGIEEVEFEVIHHSEIDVDKIKNDDLDLLYLTGRVTYDWDIEEIKMDYKKELNLIRETNIPTLGVCAGHQLIAVEYGADFGKMFEVEDGKEDIRERGFNKIKIEKNDKIFNGLNDPFIVYHIHRDEVKNVPPEFDLLGSTEMCKIQVMKHKKKDMYSVQFHPEQYTNEYPDGKILLKNLLSMNN